MFEMIFLQYGWKFHFSLQQNMVGMFVQ